MSNSSTRNSIIIQMLHKPLTSIMFCFKAVKCVFLVRGLFSPKTELYALIALCEFVLLTPILVPDVSNLLFNPILNDFHSGDFASVYIGV